MLDMTNMTLHPPTRGIWVVIAGYKHKSKTIGLKRGQRSRHGTLHILAVHNRSFATVRV